MSLIQKILIYILFTSSLFIGLYFYEDSAGGAKHDYNLLIPYIYDFQNNFQIGLSKFVNNFSTIIHFPFYYIFIGNLNKLFNDIHIVKIIYILISSFLPILFYSILKKNYDYNKDFLFLFSCLIFISPYFRSSAIWALGDNLALIFFSFSILFYLKFEKEKKTYLFYFCLISIILCCYIRYYYALFYLFYFFNSLKNLNSKQISISLLISIIFSIPAFIYFYFIVKNYNFLNIAYTYTQLNYLGNIFYVSSIILFYLIPFVFFDLKKIFLFYKNNKFQLLAVIFPLIIILLLDMIFQNKLINVSIYGGGIFRKLIDFLNLNLTFFISFFAILCVLILNYYLRSYIYLNYAVLLVFFLSFPMFTIYQKYFDPLLLIFLFGLIKFKENNSLLILNKSRLIYLYIYFFSFYIFSMYYYR